MSSWAELYLVLVLIGVIIKTNKKFLKVRTVLYNCKTKCVIVFIVYGQWLLVLCRNTLPACTKKNFTASAYIDVTKL